MSLPFFSIDRCYDSHVHLLPTGELASLKRVDDLAALSEWRNVLAEASVRGPWRGGFGWNPDQFPQQKEWGAKDLDALGFSEAVLVSHRDGHSSLVNSAALGLLGWQNRSDLPEDLRAFVQVDDRGRLLGQLTEKAHFAALKVIPYADTKLRQKFILQGQDLFLQSGFTHIREMTGDRDLLEDLNQLEESEHLKLYIDVCMHIENRQRAAVIFSHIQDFNRLKSRRVAVRGVKIFLDGALGSETAFLSFPYGGHSHQGQHLWRGEDLQWLLTEAWGQGLRVATHTIGDAALTELLQVAQGLRSKGIEGGLSIEHAEVVDPSSFALMRGLDLEFHFQPSHFLSDQKWLRQKLGSRFNWCFPWKKIEDLGFPIYFGSDSPIEKPGLDRTLLGLRTAAEQGLPMCQLDWKFAHSHPERRWGRKSQTWADSSGKILKVIQDGKILNNADGVTADRVPTDRA